jgi:hypothetical protein
MQSVLLSMSTQFDINQSILLFYSLFTRDARFIRASVVNQSCEDVGSVAKRSICSACGGYKKHKSIDDDPNKDQVVEPQGDA